LSDPVLQPAKGMKAARDITQIGMAISQRLNDISFS
jgi:hypothetical protein